MELIELKGFKQLSEFEQDAYLCELGEKLDRLLCSLFLNPKLKIFFKLEIFLDKKTLNACFVNKISNCLSY